MNNYLMIFLFSLNNYLRQSSNFKNHMICGNFNIDVLKNNNLKIIEYLNIFANYVFFFHISNSK